MTVYTYTYEYNTQKMHNPFPNSPLFFIINVHNKTVGNYKNGIFIKFFYQRVPAIQKSPCCGQTDLKVRDHVYKIKCQVTTTSVTSSPPPSSYDQNKHFWPKISRYKGPVYSFAIGEYITPDTPKNLTWRIIAIACLLVHGLINNLVIKWCTGRYICHHSCQRFCMLDFLECQVYVYSTITNK